MNKIMFDILMYLNDNTGWDSRAAARKLYKPYSVIDAEFERLNEEGVCKRRDNYRKRRAVFGEA